MHRELSINPVFMKSPADFRNYAGDDPDIWLQLIGSKVVHRKWGVGDITDVVRISDGSGKRRTCGGVFVRFSADNHSYTERFGLNDFGNGTFTAFLVRTDILYSQIMAYLKKLAIADALKIAEEYREQLTNEGYHVEHTAVPYIQLEGLLKNHHFMAADEQLEKTHIVDRDDYDLVKTQYIMEYFQRDHGRQLDAYKAAALAKMRDNLLVTARAGSGKTSLLTCLAVLLVDKYNVDPEKILVLAFNKKAAREIKERITRDLKAIAFPNARTFHSLAYQIVLPTAPILYDKSDEIFARPMSSFIRDLLRRIWNPVFQLQMYLVFRKELKELEATGALLEDAEYLIFRRNYRDISLAGEYVKSFGEKIVADFLFEHAIQYSYEKPVFWGLSVYRPDFIIYHQSRDIVLEHWALDPAVENEVLPADWTISAKQYKEQIAEKRAYWQERGVLLLETSVRDLRSGREVFEKTLKGILESAGIPCKKLPENDIQRRVIRIHVNRMTNLFGQFIQRCKKSRWDATTAIEKINAYSAGDDKEKVFIILAARVYQEYERALQDKGHIDYDILMESAVNHITQSGGRCSIRQDDHELPVRDIQWILIDEYQDFSLQFHSMLEALRRCNGNAKVFCVGDDWQAINRFAGSDLKYFKKYSDYFENAESAVLPLNYRSRKAIVEAGNRLMHEQGTPGLSLPDKDGGKVILRNVDKVWIECRRNEEYLVAYNADKKFRFFRTLDDGREVPADSGEIVARYLKTIYEVVIEEKNINKTVAILSRTGHFYHLSELSLFLKKLQNCFTDAQLTRLGGRREFERKFSISTAHGFKGLEADIVFILKACRGSFPLIHPDYSLFRLFGDTERQVLEDELRLFYVALTRAKDEVWLLTETDRESDFIRRVVNDKEDVLPF